MKNVFKKISLMFVSLFALVGLASCAESDLAKFVDRVGSDNPNVEIVSNFVVNGPEGETYTTSQHIEIAGNILHYDAVYLNNEEVLEEAYYEKLETSIVKYIKVQGSWVKYTLDDPTLPEGPQDIATQITLEDFVEVDGKWTVKPEKLEAYDVADLYLVFDEKADTTTMHVDTTVKVENADATTANYNVISIVLFKNFGGVNLTLPEATEA